MVLDHNLSLYIALLLASTCLCLPVGKLKLDSRRKYLDNLVTEDKIIVHAPEFIIDRQRQFHRERNIVDQTIFIPMLQILPVILCNPISSSATGPEAIQLMHGYQPLVPLPVTFSVAILIYILAQYIIFKILSYL